MYLHTFVHVVERARSKYSVFFYIKNVCSCLHAFSLSVLEFISCSLPFLCGIWSIFSLLLSLAWLCRWAIHIRTPVFWLILNATFLKTSVALNTHTKHTYTCMHAACINIILHFIFSLMKHCLFASFVFFFYLFLLLLEAVVQKSLEEKEVKKGGRKKKI